MLHSELHKIYHLLYWLVMDMVGSPIMSARVHVPFGLPCNGYTVPTGRTIPCKLIKNPDGFVLQSAYIYIYKHHI